MAETTLNSYTKANLPTNHLAGQLVRVIDDVRGMWLDDGTNWSPQNAEIVNASDFGVFSGTGANMTQPLLNACTAAAGGVGGNKGRVVQLPAGIIDIAGLSLMGLPCTLRGHDREGTVLRRYSAVNDHIIKSNNTTAQSGYRFYNVRFDGNRTGTPWSYDCLSLSNVVQASVWGCFFSGARHGIHYEGGSWRRYAP